MSRIFGGIRQIAFVVRDVDRAMDHWSSVLGIGPFFVKRRITFADYVYRGQPRASPVVTIALANSGSVQVELIQQHDGAPSIYKEFLKQGREGLQHVSAWLTRDGFDARKAALASSDLAIAQECTIPSSGVRLAYFAAGDSLDGLVFEISDLLDPVHYGRIQGIADAAAAWDGTEPVVEVTE